MYVEPISDLFIAHIRLLLPFAFISSFLAIHEIFIFFGFILIATHIREWISCKESASEYIFVCT